MAGDWRAKEHCSAEEIAAWTQTLARLQERWKPEMEQLKLTPPPEAKAADKLK